MNINQNETIKLSLEIATLSGQLTTANQHYVLNTINTLLFSQQNKEEEKTKTESKNKTA